MFVTQFLNNPFAVVLYLLAIVIAVSVHEYFHARVADELGDPTPDLAGRLTLDPRAHLDLMGSILFLLFGFGWGKPVPFDPYNFTHRRRGTAMVALAGPLSNFVMAGISAGILWGLGLALSGAEGILGSLGTIALVVRIFLTQFISVNVVLGIFNLLPFAPLDGFKIVYGFLPDDQADEWESLERYGIFFLIAFLLPFAGGRSMMDILVHPVLQKVIGFLIPGF